MSCLKILEKYLDWIKQYGEDNNERRISIYIYPKYLEVCYEEWDNNKFIDLFGTNTLLKDDITTEDCINALSEFASLLQNGDPDTIIDMMENFILPDEDGEGIIRGKPIDDNGDEDE